MANFPGMNPWLENPRLWSDVHFRLISAIARYLSPLVSPRYYVSVGAQAYVVTPSVELPLMRYPDVAVVEAATPGGSPVQAGQAIAHAGVEPVTVQVPVLDVIEEAYLEVRETETGQVITVIEILSPTNKRPGVGREKYERKRLEILSTHTNLVEIDLLRAWEPMPLAGDVPSSHYRILIRRGEQGSKADLYAFNLPDPIPEFPLPLQPGDEEPWINLNTLLAEVYLEGRYDIRINYRQPATPPLSEDEAKWAEEILAKDVGNSSGE